jgi:hypothetical protein
MQPRGWRSGDIAAFPSHKKTKKTRAKNGAKRVNAPSPSFDWAVMLSSSQLCLVRPPGGLGPVLQLQNTFHAVHPAVRTQPASHSAAVSTNEQALPLYCSPAQPGFGLLMKGSPALLLLGCDSWPGTAPGASEALTFWQVDPAATGTVITTRRVGKNMLSKTKSFKRSHQLRHNLGCWEIATRRGNTGGYCRGRPYPLVLLSIFACFLLGNEGYHLRLRGIRGVRQGSDNFYLVSL